MQTDVQRAAGDTDRVSDRERRDGAMAALALLVGYIPFGLVIGATVGAEGPGIARWLSTPLIMGGSAQLAVLELIDDRGALALVIVTGLTINARLLTYSASMAREWAGTSRRFRLVAAASVIDPTWALATQRIERGGSPAARRAYYVAMATVLCIGWTAIVTVGAIAGPSVDLASMDVAVPLCLSVLVLPTLRSRSGAVLVAVAAIVGWFAADAPAGTGVLIASVVAVVAAGAADAVDGANAGSTPARGPEEEP